MAAPSAEGGSLFGAKGGDQKKPEESKSSIFGGGAQPAVSTGETKSNLFGGGGVGEVKKPDTQGTNQGVEQKVEGEVKKNPVSETVAPVAEVKKSE